ncbi:hypothetical protein C8R46DRAFT_1360689 [Mycena filopes]|nr:hypothetical protein C8R46DRAFT_1360689 [Mycena filopes]
MSTQNSSATGGVLRTSQGSNTPRPKPKPKAKNTGGRGRKAAEKDEIAQLKATIERLEKAVDDATASAHTPGTQGAATQPQEVIVRLEKPKGEAGDSKRGFNLQDAMGLGDDEAEFRAIQRSVHKNVVRTNLDVTQVYRHQDPGKLAAVFKLTRKDHPWVTERRFALNWAVAEMVKQYLRNKRRYGVRVGYIPDRETRKRQREEDGQQENSNGKRRHTGTTGRVRHIDDEGSDDDDIPGEGDPSVNPVEG